MDHKQHFEQLNEGLGTFFARIGEFFTGGRPKIAGVSNAINEYYMDLDRCDRVFPPLKDTNVQVHIPKMSKDFNHPQHISYREYQEDPRRVLCELQAEINYAKKLLKFLESHNPDVVCQHNVNKDRCKKWIRTEIPSLKIDLRETEKEFQMLKKNPPADKSDKSFYMFKHITETLDSYLDYLDE